MHDFQNRFYLSFMLLLIRFGVKLYVGPDRKVIEKLPKSHRKNRRKSQRKVIERVAERVTERAAERVTVQKEIVFYVNAYYNWEKG